MTEKRSPSFLDALTPILTLVILLAASVAFFADDASWGPNQVALLLSAAVGSLVALKNGYEWHEIEKGIVKGISISLGAILILLFVGSLIGTWLLAGTVPSLIYFGMQVLDPAWFYAATCVICALVAMSIGSSWTVAATVGVAFIGVSKGMGLSDAITAGAVISGAYFGDKMSPLSETTNLAPAVAGSELFEHIRHMAWTSVPSILLAIVVFIILGLQSDAQISSERINQINSGLGLQFDISLLHLTPLAVLLFLALKRMPALPSIAIGALFGGVWAAIFQQEAISRLFFDNASLNPLHVLEAVWTTMFAGVEVETGNADLDSLLSGGGMANMLETVWLILSAMTFGAVMEHTGLLKRFVEGFLRAAKSTGSLITTTLATCIGTNVVTADQYIAIVVPGRMFKQAYEDRGLAPVNLSRTLEDAGTITSPLVPWNSCGAYMAGVLHVATGEYLLYCFFNWTSPLIAAAYGYLGFKIKMLTRDR